MKLSISNIAWDKQKDEEMYEYISNAGFKAIEIAPTRIIEKNPYSKVQEMKEYTNNLKQKYNLEISSMQSIWFGKKEKIFGTDEERKELIDYTKKAIDFARKNRMQKFSFWLP